MQLTIKQTRRNPVSRFADHLHNPRTGITGCVKNKLQLSL